jgi:hypothetical protein
MPGKSTLMARKKKPGVLKGCEGLGRGENAELEAGIGVIDFEALLAKVVHLQQELLLAVRGEAGVGLLAAGIVRDNIQGHS